MAFEYPYPLEDSVINRVNELNFESSFEIQRLAAEPILAGESCRIMAPTGSGKTLSYLLPLGAKLLKDSKSNVVVLASSPELASQIHGVFKEFYPDISTILLVGGANLKRQIERLKKKPRFICATPGRAFELFGLRKFAITANTSLVIDEIDLVIKRPNLQKVSGMMEPAGQLIVASATYSEDSLNILQQQERSLVELIAEEREGKVNHSYLFCGADKKEISLVKLLKQLKFPPSLVFVNDIRHTTHLMKVLSGEGVACMKLDSQTSKNAREKAIKDLRSGAVKLLVTSDSLARGMDFRDIHVVQYSIARDLEHFVHRSGRAGRAGTEGNNISLVTTKDVFLVEKYSKKLQLPITELKLEVKKKKAFTKKVKPKNKK
jgi:superfamily II DNA/RNA helicase